jgi:hypothetical protein
MHQYFYRAERLGKSGDGEWNRGSGLGTQPELKWNEELL